MQRASTATRSSESTQPICFENAVWAYTVGCAIAIKSGAVQGCRRRCRNRHRSSVFLHPRLRRRKPQGRSRSRQPRQQCSSPRRQSASASSQVTSPSPPLRALSKSPSTQTRSEPSPCALSSTASARTPHSSSPASTASPTVKTEFDPYTETVTVAEQKAYSNGPRADGQVLRRRQRSRGRGYHEA